MIDQKEIEIVAHRVGDTCIGQDARCNGEIALKDGPGQEGARDDPGECEGVRDGIDVFSQDLKRFLRYLLLLFFRLFRCGSREESC